MPVFNTAAHTITASPISHYYKGKAVRLALENDRLANEHLETQTDALEKNMELAERRQSTFEDSEERIRSREDREGQQYVQALGVNAAHSGLSAYNSTEGTEEEKRAAGYDASLAVIDNAIPGGRDAALQYLRDNGREVGPESFDPAEAEAILAPYRNEKDPESTSQIERMIDSLPIPEEQKAGLRLQYIEKQVSSASEPKPTPSKPLGTPTGIEQKIVEQVSTELFDAEEFSEYGFNEQQENNIRRWIWEDAERLARVQAQLGNEVGFESAARQSAGDAKKFIVAPSDPGFFSNDSNEFEAPMHVRGQKIEGADGQIWVVTGWDENGAPIGEPIGS